LSPQFKYMRHDCEIYWFPKSKPGTLVDSVKDGIRCGKPAVDYIVILDTRLWVCADHYDQHVSKNEGRHGS